LTDDDIISAILDPFGIVAWGAFFWLLVALVAIFFLLALVDCWRARKAGKGWWPWR